MLCLLRLFTLAFLYFLFGQTHTRSTLDDSHHLASWSCFPRSPDGVCCQGSTLLVTAASTSRPVMRQPDQCPSLGDRGAKPQRVILWAVQFLLLLTCFHSVDPKTFFFFFSIVTPKERHWNISATLSSPLFGNPCCVLKFQQRNCLFKTTDHVEVSCVCKLASRRVILITPGNNSIFVHKVSPNPMCYAARWREITLKSKVTWRLSNWLSICQLPGYLISFVWAWLQSKYPH